ncbi:MAG: hypothetical protein RIS33_250 [Actinomycetota bacterium]
MVSVLVCDDQELVRDALRVVLSEDDEIEIRLAASGVSDAVTALDTDGVDVAVIDVRLPEESGLSIADWIRDHRPSTKVVLISVRVTDELLVESASLGVAAVVDKSIGVVELSRIVREVSAGRNFLTRDVVRAAQSRLETRGFARLANLGDVDREIMRLIAPRSVRSRDRIEGLPQPADGPEPGEPAAHAPRTREPHAVGAHGGRVRRLESPFQPLSRTVSLSMKSSSSASDVARLSERSSSIRDASRPSSLNPKRPRVPANR